MTLRAVPPVMLSEQGAVSYDTRPGPKRGMLPGRSDQIRHFQLRDHRGSVTLEGHAALVEVDPVRDAISHAQSRGRGLGGFVVALVERLAVGRFVRLWVRAGRERQQQDRQDSQSFHRASPSHELIPVIGLDFGGVFSPGAPMGSASFDHPASRVVERGGATLGLLYRTLRLPAGRGGCHSDVHEGSALRRGIAGSKAAEDVFESHRAETCCRNSAGDCA